MTGFPLTPEQRVQVRILWWRMQNCGLSAYLGPEFERRHRDAQDELSAYLTSVDGRG